MSHQDPEMEKMLLEAERFLNEKSHAFLDNKKPKDRENPMALPSKPIVPIAIDSDSNADMILIDYKKRLKGFGFPDIGNIILSKDETDKEKTLKFFDFLISRKAKENAEYQSTRNQSEVIAKKYEILEGQNAKLEREITKLNDELKTITKNKKDYEGKLTNTKDACEKQLTSLKNSNSLLTNKLSRLTIDKRAVEEKLTKLSDAYSRLTNKQTPVKPSNSIDITDYLKQNDLGKMLSKVKGAEKLVEMLKSGYNESLRELLFEINSLKTFIMDIHTELKALVEYPSDFDADLMKLPFLDTITKIKLVFMQNIQLIKASDKSNDDYLIHMGTQQVSKYGKESFAKDKLPDFDYEEETSHHSSKKVGSIQQEAIGSESKEKAVLKAFAKTLNSFDTSEIQGQRDDYENYEQELEMQKNRWTKTFLQLKEDDNND